MRITLALLGVASVFAAIFDEEFSGTEVINFAGRMSFDKWLGTDEEFNDETSECGKYTVTVTIPDAKKENFKCTGNDDCRIRVFEYSDESKSWPSIYGEEGVTCDMAAQASKACGAKEGKDCKLTSTLTPGEGANEGNWVLTKTQSLSQRFTRWWFVAVIACDADNKPINMDGVTAHSEFLNVQRASWSVQLGYDVMGLNTFYLTMFFLYLIFYCVHMYGVYNLSSKLEYLHPMVKLFAICLTLQFVAIIFPMLHWGIYSTNGIGVNALRQGGEVVDSITRVIFMLILTLMAKGWTISGDELTNGKFIVGALVVFLLVHSAILLWKYQLEDPAAVHLETGLEVIMWIELCMWFLFAVYFTYTVLTSWKKEENPVKRKLFLQLAVVFTIWMFLYPTLSFINLARNSDTGWAAAKQKVTSETTLCLSMLGYMFLSFLLWPSRAEEYFNINKPDVMRANIDTYEQL